MLRGLGVLLLFLSIFVSSQNLQDARQQAERFWQQGRAQEAIQTLKQAVDANPTAADAHYTLGWYYRMAGDQGGSVRHNTEALKLAPGFVAAYINLGVSYQNMGNRGAARKAYEDALHLQPNFFEAHNSLAILDGDEGKVVEAKEHYAKAIAIRPDPGAMIKSALLLPPVFSSEKAVRKAVKRYGSELDNLIAQRFRIKDSHFTVGATPFYLAYTGEEIVSLMQKLATLYTQSDAELTYVAPHLTDFAATGHIDESLLPLVEGKRIKVGVISRHFRWHSIGKLMRGLFGFVPRDKIHLTAILPPQQSDFLTQQIMQRADAVLRVPHTMQIAREKIASERFHVLFYPDIGMEAFTYFLSFSRLAPVQCVTHGHPSTTGVPNMDYFVSFKRYEEASAQRFYTEKLVRIDGLSDRYERPPTPSPLRDRTALGLPLDHHIYLAPQSLYKFHPGFDSTLASVLDADPNGYLYIISERYPGWGKQFTDRLAKTSAIAAQRIRWLQRSDNPTFLNYIAVSDVVLDLYPFGGDTSSRDAFLMGTPVVTLPSDMLPGRYTQGFYHEMGVTDLIAHNKSHYVELALRTANDRRFRDEVAERIKVNNHKLFEDDRVVTAWGEFFVNAWESLLECAWDPNQ